MPADQVPSRMQELRPRPVWQLFLAAGWFALASAMAFWPHAVGRPEPSCMTNDDAGIICFILESWGTPLGIGITAVCGLLALWGYLKPGVSAASAAPGPSSTVATGTASLGGGPGVQPRPPGSLGRVGKAIVIVIIAWVIFLVCGTAWLVAWVLLYPYFE